MDFAVGELIQNNNLIPHLWLGNTLRKPVTVTNSLWSKDSATKQAAVLETSIWHVRTLNHAVTYADMPILYWDHVPQDHILHSLQLC